MNKIIVGIDEAGRGPLAGPVVASAVAILERKKFRAQGNFDSKKLSPKAREVSYQILPTHPQVVCGTGQVSEKIIDEINIYHATKLAMRRALYNLKRNLKVPFEDSFLLIDGNMPIAVRDNQKTIIKADETVFLCMLASIVAKVTRDRAMLRYHKLYPEYGFAKHKGYGTPHHLVMLKKHGISPIHRKSFAPCRNL